MSDFRTAVDFFPKFGAERENARESKSGVLERRKEGEEEKRSPQYEPLEATVDHLIITSTVSPNTWKAIRGDTEDQVATLLHIEADPSAPTGNSSGEFGWGLEPFSWQNDDGSVLVVRMDGNELLPTHLWAICAFCQFRLTPLIEDAMEKPIPMKISP
ncbi:hypothetical protein GX50_05417 [[Emmonsia] crescens]|uniref:Uncharacterized protein n=1 Tax=[Emmonsia] crescens TaxID=73230 RepID=A0A2B7ZF46_9EURO|nr:hypothetical protein GX50_05417 [Emmonsia crescens]